MPSVTSTGWSKWRWKKRCLFESKEGIVGGCSSDRKKAFGFLFSYIYILYIYTSRGWFEPAHKKNFWDWMIGHYCKGSYQLTTVLQYNVRRVWANTSNTEDWSIHQWKQTFFFGFIKPVFFPKRLRKNWPRNESMYFLWKMGIFHCYLTLPEGKWMLNLILSLGILRIRISPWKKPEKAAVGHLFVHVHQLCHPQTKRQTTTDFMGI